MSTLGQISTALEEQLFTGREREIAIFRSWLADEAAPARILTVSGPGGVGKSALLRTFSRLAGELGRPVLLADGHTFPPTPPGLLGAFSAVDLAELAGYLNRIGPLLLIDSFEELVDLSEYLYSEFLPALGGTVKVVVAGRALPTPWAKNGHWHSLILPLRLSGLSSAESRDYLEHVGVHDLDLAAQILAAVGGHPLALSLAADLAMRLGTHDLSAVPEWHMIVRSLIDDVLREVADPQLRALIDACAVVRELDEDMLTAIDGSDELSAAFDHLCCLSVVEPAEQGVTLHQAVRPLLIQDLRWRRRAKYNAQRARALSHIKEQALSAEPAEYEHLATERLFLAANEPVKELLFGDDGPDHPFLEPGKPTDGADLARIWSSYLLSHATPAKVRPTIDLDLERDFLEAVLAYPGARVRVARSGDGKPVGFTTIVPICQDSLGLLSQHPGFASLLQTYLPPPERALLPSHPADSERAYLLHLAHTDIPWGGVRPALLRDSLGVFLGAGTYICCTPIPSLQSALEALGFVRVDGAHTVFWGEAFPAAGYKLNLSRSGRESWLVSLTDRDTHLPLTADNDALLGLTQRERSVLSLLIRGAATSRRIAAELCITPGTANLHVKRILSKLGFGSRAELVAWATRDGLVERLGLTDKRGNDTPAVELLRNSRSLDWTQDSAASGA